MRLPLVGILVLVVPLEQRSPISVWRPSMGDHQIRGTKKAPRAGPENQASSCSWLIQEFIGEGMISPRKIRCFFFQGRKGAHFPLVTLWFGWIEMLILFISLAGASYFGLLPHSWGWRWGDKKCSWRVWDDAAMKHPPFVDVAPIGKGGFPVPCSLFSNLDFALFETSF